MVFGTPRRGNPIKEVTVFTSGTPPEGNLCLITVPEFTIALRRELTV